MELPSSAVDSSTVPRYPTRGKPLIQVDSIAACDISSQDFFNNYVKNRIPVKLTGHISDPCWSGDKWIDLSYLDKKCGHCSVKIEKRGDPNIYPTDFGNGIERHVSFSDFLHSIESGEESLYMTTQKLGYSAEGEPDIVSPPLTELVGEYPWRPAIMGNLVTQNINIWLGRSKAGTCSGLHHDHHDNLYILLRGQKSFKLFSPAELPNLYVNGTATRIHPNGRINYAEQQTRADGADINASRALAASIKLDQLASQANDDSDAEEQIDAAMEDLLDAHMECSDQDDWSESEEDGEEESDAYAGERVLEVPEQIEAFLGVRDTKRQEGSQCLKRGRSESPQRGVAKVAKEDSSDRPHVEAEEDEAPVLPTNFSQVVTSLPEAELQEKFPLFMNSKVRQLDVTLNEGEMLYLPCGWFHEVTSMNMPGRSSGDDFHLAVNYWFHPPDGESFEQPYNDDFWPESWRRRKLG